MFNLSKDLLISSATVIVRAGEAIWLIPFATMLFNVCSAVTVECCVLYLCCVGIFGMDGGVVSAGHVGCTRGSGMVSRAADVRGMRGVGGVCEMCVWLWAAWEERIGFGLYQSCGNRRSVVCVSVFGLRWCRWGLRPGSGRVRWCYVCVSLDYLCRWQVLLLLGVPSVQSCCTLSISASYHVFVCVRYR